MLAIGSGATPYQGAGSVAHRYSDQIHRLAQTLHIQLLQPRRQQVEVLGVWQDDLGVVATEITIPDSQQRKRHRKIVLEGCALEVLVHSLCALKKLSEAGHVRRQRNTQPNSGPQ